MSGTNIEDIVIPYQKKQIKGCITHPCIQTEGSSKCSEVKHFCVILTHGAGGDMNLPHLVHLSDELAQEGFMVVRFTCKGLNLGYRVKVYTEVLKYVKKTFPDLKGIFLAGRSMGARAAVGTSSAVQGTQLSDTVKGVICLSYPLHKQGDEGNLRDSPLFELAMPSVFVSGTKDEMCKKSLLEKTLKPVSTASVLWIDGADHGLKVKAQAENITIKTISCHLNKWCKEMIGENDNVEPKKKRQRKI